MLNVFGNRFIFTLFEDFELWLNLYFIQKFWTVIKFILNGFGINFIFVLFENSGLWLNVYWMCLMILLYLF